MTQANRTATILAAALAAISLAAAFGPAEAQELPRKAAPAHRHALRFADGAPRPLTITRRPWTVTTGLHAGILVRGNEIYAPGGFSAHHYGQHFASYAEARNAMRNEELRDSADVFLSGYPGLGGLGVSREGGFDNPAYGNTYSRYVGYNGVPSDLAFGPAYGNRYATDHDPSLDDDDEGSPSPADLGYTRASLQNPDQ